MIMGYSAQTPWWGGNEPGTSCSDQALVLELTYLKGKLFTGYQDYLPTKKYNLSPSSSLFKAFFLKNLVPWMTRRYYSNVPILCKLSIFAKNAIMAYLYIFSQIFSQFWELFFFIVAGFQKLSVKLPEDLLFNWSKGSGFAGLDKLSANSKAFGA